MLGLLVPVGADGSIAPVDEVLEPGVTLPNLVPDVAEVYVFRPFVLDEATGTFVPGPPQLHFDTRAQNLGAVPLQLTLDDVESPQSSSVSQCVSWTASRLCRAQHPVGGFTWHEEHTHFHFEDFAAYELRRLRPNGRVDYSSRGLLASSDKVSFCLMDTTTVRPDAFPVGTYQSCTPAMQGISPGWTDVYGGGLPGQQFRIDSLDDGQYAVVVRMDHGERLYETDDTDNVVEVIVELSGGLSGARIVERRYP